MPRRNSSGVHTYVRHKSCRMNVRCKLAATVSVSSHVMGPISTASRSIKGNDILPRLRPRSQAQENSLLTYFCSFSFSLAKQYTLRNSLKHIGGGGTYTIFAALPKRPRWAMEFSSASRRARAISTYDIRSVLNVATGRHVNHYT